jgi:hypothetical protein
MREGISTNRRCDPFAPCLRENGNQFVFRYHSRTTTQPEKRISPVEAAELARGDLDIATVYQDRARLPADFGFARGRLDGLAAHAFAAQIGQPPGSAIYFAVDADFTPREVNGLIVPYFKGLHAGMDEAAGGTSTNSIGVYGSGLVCATVRDREHLARFAWLAEATRWFGSDTFTTWDVRQHRNAGERLCGLGDAWQRCEARDEFGQFRPLGFDVRRDEGRFMRVTAPQLNLRRAPTTASVPPLAVLREGQVVRVLGAAVEPWRRIRVTLGGSDVIGFVSGRFLEAVGAPAPERAPVLVPPVHFRADDPRSRRDSTTRRAQPLGESPRPARDPAATAAVRVAQLGEIVRWLAVDSSDRYQRTEVTFCNVYAADFCFLANVYLPRTWWTDSALTRIGRGEQPEVIYEATVREMRADDLFAWLVAFGPQFGWRRVFDATALQDAANAGGVGVVCADLEADGKPGHITLVVPETPADRARRDADRNVTLPLQSQAGAVNFRYSIVGRPWWEDIGFREHGFFVHA